MSPKFYQLAHTHRSHEQHATHPNVFRTDDHTRVVRSPQDSPDPSRQLKLRAVCKWALRFVRVGVPTKTKISPYQSLHINPTLGHGIGH